MIRAVFLAHTAAPSGAELATLRLLAALRAEGAVDASMLLTADGPLVDLLRARAIPVTVCPGRAGRPALHRAGSGPVRLLTGAADLARLGARLGTTVRAAGAQVLVAQSTKALLMGAVAARCAGIPLVWQVHDRISAEYFGGPLAVALRLLGRLTARGVIANSRSTLHTLYTGGRPAVIAYPGIESAPVPGRAPQRDPDRVRIVMVGRLTSWKGQDVLLRALGRMRHRPAAVHLVGGTFFGEEDYRAELEHTAAALGLPVEFTGHADDPAAYFAQADIAVHCSVLAEPFGQVVVEAMAAGCAVVAAAAGGPTEIIRPRVDGVLTTPGDPDALAAALDRLVGDPAERARLGAAARERAREFTIAATARTVTGLLEQVTTRKPVRAR